MHRKSEREWGREHLLMLTQYPCANYVLHTFIQIHRRPDIWNVSKRLCIIFMSQFSFQSPPHFLFVLLVPISCRACTHTVRSKEANGVDECLIKSVMMIWWNGFFLSLCFIIQTELSLVVFFLSSLSRINEHKWAWIRSKCWS